MRPNFWRGKRVFVTGHTGFKGSWLCLLLHSLGARVTGHALAAPTEPNLFSLARVGELVDDTRADVRDLDPLAERLRAADPEVVFHLAAQSVVLESYRNPVDTYATNVMGTVNLLEAVRRLQRPCVVINVTTDKCYENKGWVWGYRENDALGGRDPYSSSKACAEQVGQCYRDAFFPLDRIRQHGVALGHARAGNVVGGGDWTAHQLIPATMAALAKSEPVVLRHPHSVRPWQHVLDCLGGYLSLAEALANDPRKFSGEWNFGPGDADARPVSYVVEQLAAHWGRERPCWVQDTADHGHEEQRLRLDVHKAADMLHWRCRLSLDEALQWVASWYARHHRGADARELCREQIGGYLARLEGAPR